MNQLFFYLFQVIAASGLLYGYYHFALRNKRFHRYNRFYLLMAIVISSFIPFLNIPVYFSQKETESSVMLQTLQVISSPSLSSESPIVSTAIHTESITATWFTTANVIYLLYLFILSFFLIRVFISLSKIRSIIKRNPVEQLDKIKFINTNEPGTPFSFFRWLFWNNKIELHSEKGEQIFRHELFHIQQKHSWDIIFMEFISILFWINPFFHLIKKELKAIHEFLADEFAIGEDKNWQYAELLLMQVLNTSTHLVNPFFHNQIKRRIAMITTSAKPSYRYLRKMMLLPVAAVIVTLFAFNYRNKKSIDPNEFEKAINSITVVVDAGHGGTDAGVKTKDGKLTEANISLAIAKKIESMAHDYNINVIMTREDEKFPGGASTKNDALRKRVELVNNAKPSAFIAIHMNTTAAGKQSDKSGFDAYVTKQRNNSADIKLASLVLGELKNIYTTREEIKQREDAGIFIIDNVKFPSLLLECGYINNPNDLAFISDKKNQELLARAILKALVTFANREKKYDLGFQFLLNKNEGDTSKPKDLKEYENYLVVINGIVQSKKGFKAVDSSVLFAKDGVKITVYKDSTGTKKYGQKGKDGVIEITTNDAKRPKSDVKKDKSELSVKEVWFADTTKPQKDEPLIVIDGKPRPDLSFSKTESVISVDKIESIKILNNKDKNAIAKYGAIAKNGVIEITTKGESVIKIDSKKTGDDKIFEKVEIEASFPGGVNGWMEFLQNNLKSIVPVDNGANPGIYTVIVQFIVHKDGSISDLKTLTNHGHGMEDEVLRVMKRSPNWIPAMQNGCTVTSYRKQPITFAISSK